MESKSRTLHISGYRNYLPDDHPIPLSIAKFSDILTELSDGKITLKHIQPTIPSPMKQIENLRQAHPPEGTPEIMLASVTGLADLVKEFTLLDIPFVADDETQIDALLDGELGTALLNKLEGTGIVGLSYWENGFRQMTNSKQPITNVDNFKSMNIRVIPKDVFSKPFEALGSKTISMYFSKVYAALKAKEVDGQENYYSQILTAKLYEVQNYLSQTNHAYGALTIVINQGVWDSLNDSEQELIQSAAKQAGLYQRQLSRKKTIATHGKLAELGMQLNLVSKAERQEIKDIMVPAAMALTQDYDPEIMRLFKEKSNVLKPSWHLY